ncbi:uncharacterized protein P174DRAFT_106244 [Aspergillus novofumigatus IBT 16806]|uniref:Uncharacterized protein n=1 Tax=Aspergillus novofumigatus (strain IBT 16806) TaxID=1392255 RepID=A0A2I1CI02_ASPN1|nr:uncharacterized protein P174DRAFT_106244 [Aspergillus novofumigatus IBT 16806]PKX97256.1 hypothetical protein P174DRAFT_106244 [Aspergillus novofumigatus IBT 16806]
MRQSRNDGSLSNVSRDAQKTGNGVTYSHSGLATDIHQLHKGISVPEHSKGQQGASGGMREGSSSWRRQTKGRTERLFSCRLLLMFSLRCSHCFRWGLGPYLCMTNIWSGLPTVLRSLTQGCVKAEAAGTVTGVSNEWIVDSLCIRALPA